MMIGGNPRLHCKKKKKREKKKKIEQPIKVHVELILDNAAP